MGFEKIMDEVSEVLNEKIFSNISGLLDQSFNDIFKQLGEFSPVPESMQLPQLDLFDSSAVLKSLDSKTSTNAVKQISESVVEEQKDAQEMLDLIIEAIR